ncbi:copper resistance CopC family protein [Brevundimonas vesicularis]|uniref:copper resistance CopC family protein n=1 Tax=Brevundimonas vesicularis TaxID=41276 RepID=UPI00082EB1CA|nr:copper resistance protein CopC [Brevundimonas vesicularis]
MRTLITLAVALAMTTAAGAVHAQTASNPHAGHDMSGMAMSAPASGVQTTPSDGWMGAVAPTSFSATFPHAMRLTTLSVKTGDEAAVDVALPAAEPAMTISVPLPTIGKGNHVLTWSAQGADGHEMNGTVRFMVH